MKKLFLAHLFFCGILLNSCYFPEDNDPIISQTEYYPLIMDRQAFEETIKLSLPRTIENPGKIYFKDDFIFLNEKFKGIHIIDNTNPSSPKNKAFLIAPGNVDIAMKQNIMYIDHAVDLVAIDLANPENIKIQKRMRDVFPELLPPDGQSIPPAFTKSNRPENSVIVGWSIEKPENIN